jgi:hypothetical protein
MEISQPSLPRWSQTTRCSIAATALGTLCVSRTSLADLLKEVLPVGASTNHETVRQHLQATAQRMEQDLGEERQASPFETPGDGDQPLPDGPMTVGIDGGYVRSAHKEGCFEVIAGRSVVAFRRAEGEEVPPVKCFGFVQTFDNKPRRRLWEVMKSQGHAGKSAGRLHV